MFITEQMLIERRACAGQVGRFTRLFPEGVEVTPELCAQYAQEFEFDWASERFLSPPQQDEYNLICEAAWLEFDRIVAPARAKYILIYDEARVEFESTCAPTRAKFGHLRAPAWAAYDLICDEAPANFARIDAALAKYRRIDEEARAEFDRTREVARAKYKRACAAAFAHATTL